MSWPRYLVADPNLKPGEGKQESMFTQRIGGRHRWIPGRPSPADFGAKLPAARHPRTMPFEVIRQRIAGGAR